MTASSVFDAETPRHHQPDNVIPTPLTVSCKSTIDNIIIWRTHLTNTLPHRLLQHHGGEPFFLCEHQHFLPPRPSPTTTSPVREFDNLCISAILITQSPIILAGGECHFFSIASSDAKTPLASRTITSSNGAWVHSRRGGYSTLGEELPQHLRPHPVTWRQPVDRRIDGPPATCIGDHT